MHHLVRALIDALSEGDPVEGSTIAKQISSLLDQVPDATPEVPATSTATPYFHDYDTRPIGGGNPYYACVDCGRSDPEINGRIEGHLITCAYRRRKTAELAQVPTHPPGSTRP